MLAAQSVEANTLIDPFLTTLKVVSAMNKLEERSTTISRPKLLLGREKYRALIAMQMQVDATQIARNQLVVGEQRRIVRRRSPPFAV